MFTVEQVNDNQYVVRFDGPGRIEITGDFIAYAYGGEKDDPEQEPSASVDTKR